MSKMPRAVTRRRKDKDQPAAMPKASAAGPAAKPAARPSNAPSRPTQADERHGRARRDAPNPTGPVKNLVDEQALNDLAGMDADAFAQAMGGVLTERKRFSTGDRVSGRVVGESERYWLVDIGDKAEAVLTREDMPELEMGQTVQAFVMGRDAMGLRIGTKLTGGPGARAHLEDAAEAGLPIEGRVLSRNAGGFTIEVAGTKAFCPISQIDLHAIGDMDRFVGRTVTVKVIEMRGRDVVVSARAVQQEARAELAESQWATLAEGDTLTGTVLRVQSFGAFVDVGGLDGLVPRSELSWDRSVKVEELIEPGQKIEVRVLRVDRDAKKLTLSLKDPAAAPWSRVGTEFIIGHTYEGTVVRVTEFGAFVRLAPGLEGLVHISALSDERVESVEDVVKTKQKVSVRLLSVDRDAKRLELSMKAASQGHKPSQASAGSKSLGTFADLFAKARK